MEPRISVVTLGVSDLHRSLAFYQALGFHSDGIIGTEFVGDATTAGGSAAMFALRDNLILALYGRDDLAKDANISAPQPQSGAFSIGYLVPTREEVDVALSEAEHAGATLTEPPHARPWGIYSGYFRDPDGHLWEVIWNPASQSV